MRLQECKCIFRHHANIYRDGKSTLNGPEEREALDPGFKDIHNKYTPESEIFPTDISANEVAFLTLEVRVRADMYNPGVPFGITK